LSSSPVADNVSVISVINHAFPMCGDTTTVGELRGRWVVSTVARPIPQKPYEPVWRGPFTIMLTRSLIELCQKGKRARHQIRLAIVLRPRPPEVPVKKKKNKEMEIIPDYVWVVCNFLLWTLVPNKKKELCKLIM